MTLKSQSMTALMRLEARRLNKRISAKDQRASRSQYSGKITGYDADQGVAMVGIPTGGTLYAKSITTSAQQSVAVSLPSLLPTGSTDAKPVL